MMFTLEGNWFSVLRGLCLCFCASNTVREADSQFWTCICLVILYVFQYMFLITILPYLKHTFHWDQPTRKFVHLSDGSSTTLS